MNVVSVIQARIGSQRLPGKALAEIAGKPSIVHVIERVKRATTVNKVCLAIPFTGENIPLRNIANSMEIPYVLGPELDVLDRFMRAALTMKADVIVRITGDCPMIDPKVIDHVVSKVFFGPGQIYYSIVGTDETWPDGLDTEAIRIEALKHADFQAAKPSDREHVTPWIWANAGNSLKLSLSPNMGYYRWTLDEQKDLDFMRSVIPRLPRDYDYMDVVKLIEENPGLVEINSGIKRNEGYKP